MTPGECSERDQQLRRTRAVRRGVVAAGAAGALGTALAIGTTIDASGTTQQTVPNKDTYPTPGQGWVGQTSPPDQLAAPSGGGEPQGRSGGS